MIIGIDIGGTTTDIVGFNKNKEIIDLFTVKASDPVASASGALGKFINKNELKLSEIEKIAITGVGSSYINGDLLGISTLKIGEFKAIGLGGAFLTDLNQAVIVSLGTGTAIVKIQNGTIKHLGGTGVGGGTILGLARSLLNATDFDTIIKMAEKGELENIDLILDDISTTNIGNLPKEATVSNFGKVKDNASKEDYAIGILNLVYQTVGVVSGFAINSKAISDLVFTGKLAQIELGQKILKKLKSIKFNEIDFHFPEQGEFTTAIGAAYSILKS